MLSASRAAVSSSSCLSSSLLPSALVRSNLYARSAAVSLTRRKAVTLPANAQRLLTTSVRRRPPPLRQSTASLLVYSHHTPAFASSIVLLPNATSTSAHFPAPFPPAFACLVLVRAFSAASAPATKPASTASTSSNAGNVFTGSSNSSSSSTAPHSTSLPSGASFGTPKASTSPPHAPAPSTATTQNATTSAPTSSSSSWPTLSTSTASTTDAARPLSASEVFASGAQTAAAASTDTSTAPSIVAAINDPPPSRAQRLWARVKQECRHYWNGTKLLYADIKIAASLTRQVLNGHELDRRERKQLTRTSADILRLVPFLVIMIVPFMEFALPVLLKLFPNMLPSTYLDRKGEEAKLKKQLAAKIEMARFLQDTTQLMAAQLLDKEKLAGEGDTEERRVTVSKFQTLMSKVKRGESVKNDDILAVSRLFDEDFTLDNLNHEQLAAMCRLLDLRVFGSDWVLRYKLNKKLDELRDDDKAIEKEGVDSLTLAELQEACRARGIHSGQTVSYMRRKLADWLELSLKHDVPISLLVLSRAFSVSLAGTHREVDLSEGLAQTLKHIPDVVVEDTKENIAHQSDDVHEKLELARREEAEREKKRSEQAHATVVPEVKKKSVVGLAEMEERLEEIKEENDEVEQAIDTAIAAGEKGKPTAAPAVGAEVTAQSKDVTVKKDDKGAAGVGVERAKEKGVEKKRVEKVDALNDQVEALLDRVQQELQQHVQQDTVTEAGKAGEPEKKQSQ